MGMGGGGGGGRRGMKGDWYSVRDVVGWDGGSRDEGMWLGAGCESVRIEEV